MDTNKFNIGGKRPRRKIIRFTRRMLVLISKEIEDGWMGDEFDILDGEVGAGMIRHFGRLSVFIKSTRSEILYGLSFFICQQFITYVVSNIKKMHESLKEKGVALKTTNGSKLELLKIATKVIQGTNITEIQAIDALANYYKHQDEWTDSWKSLKQPHAQTANLLLELGLNEDVPIFMKALQHFGIADFKGLHRLPTILEKWGFDIYNLYEAELKFYNIELEIGHVSRKSDSQRPWTSENFFDGFNQEYLHDQSKKTNKT